MDMGDGPSCKISMLWNWYTVDACKLHTINLAMSSRTHHPRLPHLLMARHLQRHVRRLLHRRRLPRRPPRSTPALRPGLRRTHPRQLSASSGPTPSELHLLATIWSTRLLRSSRRQRSAVIPSADLPDVPTESTAAIDQSGDSHVDVWSGVYCDVVGYVL